MTIQKLGLFALAVATSTFTACSSDNGTTPTASGVFPAQGFTGRSLRVEISGDATKWKDGATVSFGDGVTVNMVEVASPTDLFADVTIDPAAMSGMRDVTVTSGGTFTLSQAFEVDSPVAVTAEGTFAQGSLVLITINNLDPDNQFDTTSVTDSSGNVTFPNINFTVPSGVAVFPSAVSQFQIQAQVDIDVTAAAGAISFTSGTGTTMFTTNLSDLSIMTRTATALDNSGATGTSGANLASNLYELTPSGAASVIDLSATSSDPSAVPLLAVLDSSGAWANTVFFGERQEDFFGDVIDPATSMVSRGTSPFYVVYLDVSGAAEPFQIASQSTSLNVLAEAEPNNTVATAQSLTLPALFDTAAISPDADIDVVKFTVPAGATKTIRVLNAGSDANTDLLVELLSGAACTTAEDFSDLFGDGNCEMNTSFGVTECDSDQITTGAAPEQFCLKITAGPSFDSSANDYALAVVLQ